MRNLTIWLFGMAMVLATLTISCEEQPVPKPKAQLRLEYPGAEYAAVESGCPFLFEKSDACIAVINGKCWVNLEYRELKASVNMTYRPVEDNLQELLQEAEKLTFNHAIKADGISSRPFVNEKNKVYGSVFEVSGNAASPCNFILQTASITLLREPCILTFNPITIRFGQLSDISRKTSSDS